VAAPREDADVEHSDVRLDLGLGHLAPLSAERRFILSLRTKLGKLPLVKHVRYWSSAAVGGASVMSSCV